MMWILDPATGKMRQATQEEVDAMRARADEKRFGCLSRLSFLGAVVVAAIMLWTVKG